MSNSTQHIKIWRRNNPFKYAYQTLKDNAKRREKGFSLTLDEFKGFCLETGYMVLKGINAEDATIDRIDESKGYELGNIRLLTVQDNAARRWHPNRLYSYLIFEANNRIKEQPF